MANEAQIHPNILFTASVVKMLRLSSEKELVHRDGGTLRIRSDETAFITVNHLSTGSVILNANILSTTHATIHPRHENVVIINLVDESSYKVRMADVSFIILLRLLLNQLIQFILVSLSILLHLL